MVILEKLFSITMVVVSENFDNIILTAFPILEVIIKISSPTEFKKIFASLAQETLMQAN